jgi:hypothetical protein
MDVEYRIKVDGAMFAEARREMDANEHYLITFYSFGAFHGDDYTNVTLLNRDTGEIVPVSFSSWRAAGQDGLDMVIAAVLEDA